MMDCNGLSEDAIHETETQKLIEIQKEEHPKVVGKAEEKLCRMKWQVFECFDICNIETYQN